MKKISKILLFLIFVGLVFAIFIFLRNRPGEKKEELAPVPPKIPTYVKEPINIAFNVQETGFSFPEKIRLLSVSVGELNKETATSLAFKLGFTGEPEEFEDINEGVKYYWRNADNFLVVTPKSGTIKYGPANEIVPSVLDKKLNDEALKENAISFISNLGIIDQTKLKGVTVLPLKESGSVEGFSSSTREGADVFQINLTYSVSDYEILTLNPLVPLIYVRILPSGEVFDFAIVFLKETSLGLTEFKLKSFEEIKTSTSQYKIVSILNGFLNLAELTAKDIQNASIEKISLSYLYEGWGTNFLQPVFVLEGPVSVSGTEANRAIFYLPAISNQP